MDTIWSLRLMSHATCLTARAADVNHRDFASDGIEELQVALGHLGAGVALERCEEHAEHRLAIWTTFEHRGFDRPWRDHGFDASFAIAGAPRRGPPLAMRVGLLVAAMGVELVGLSPWQPWLTASVAAALLWIDHSRRQA